MSDEVVWVIVAGALVVGELLTLDLLLVMFALAALVAAAVAALDAGLAWQIVAFVVAAGGLTLGLRPIARRHLTSGPVVPMGLDALVGVAGVVTERIDGAHGRVRLAGDVWSARSFPADEVIEAGAAVRVLRIEGAHAVVHRAAAAASPDLPAGSLEGPPAGPAADPRSSPPAGPSSGPPAGPQAGPQDGPQSGPQSGPSPGQPPGPPPGADPGHGPVPGPGG